MSDPIICQRKPFVQNVQPGTYWWCACGRSSHQPFCDGSHKGTGLAPERVVLETAATVALCNCKHSANKPYCDGSHSKVRMD